MKRFQRIESSAGGGKTTKLVDRYIELLKKGIRFNRILAITFTNKASEEMKRRILKRLKELALEGENIFLSLLEGKDGIIENFSDFSIKTIDAFLFSLLKSCAFDLDISPDLDIKEEFGEIMEEAVDEIILQGTENSYQKEKICDFLKFLSENSASFNPRKGIIEHFKSFLEMERILVESNYIFEPEKLKGIFTLLKNILKEKKKREGFLFLSDISPFIFRYIKESDPPYLLYKLGEKFYHYLIDEFQDTSLIQWESLKPLVLNALSGEDEEKNKGTFFYVGDPKQSIYRWRGTRWELFKDIHHEFEKILENEEFDFSYIKENKRSAPSIVKFVNNLFKKENLKNYFRVLDYLSYFSEVEKVYENAVQEWNKDFNYEGYVEIKVINKKKSEAEEEIFSYIKEIIDDLIKRGKKYGDIAILERINRDCKKIINFLLSKGYPVYTSYEVSIEDLPLIKTVIYFFKVLANEMDRFSFLNLIQTDFFKELFRIDEEKVKEFLLSENKNLKEFLKLFPNEFGKIYFYFKKLSKTFSPYYLLLEFDKVFEIGKKYKKEYLQFLSLLKGISEESENVSIYDFVKKFEKSPYIFSPSEKDAINVLTVHKAKGLEFDVVILPFAPITTFSDRGKFIIYDKNNEKPKLLLKKALSDEEEKKYLDAFNVIQELNLLYVALTRAKEELYIVVNNNRKKTWGGFIMGSLKEKLKHNDIFKEGEKRSLKEDIKVEKEEFSWERKEPISIIELSKKIFVKSESESEITIHEEVLKGEWIHLVLSKIKNLKEKNFEEEIESAYKRAKAEWELFRVFKEDFASLTYFKEKLKKDFIRRFFFTDKKVNTEFEVVDRKGNIFRIDRLIFDEAIEIVEFKTGDKKEKSHVEQLTNYLEIIREIYGKETRGYLIYIDREEIYEV